MKPRCVTIQTYMYHKKERETQRETDSQTDRQTETERDRDRYRETEMNERNGGDRLFALNA